MSVVRSVASRVLIGRSTALVYGDTRKMAGAVVG